MKVVVLAWQYPPARCGGTELATRKLATHLVRRGHEVIVVTTRDGRLPARTVEEGIVVHRVRSLAPRVVKYWWYCVNVAVLVRQLRPDVVHAQALYAGLPALICRIGFGRPYMVVGQGSDVYSPRRLGGWLSRLVVRNADSVVALTDHMKRAMVRMCSREIAVIPNGVDPQEFARRDKNHCRCKLGIEFGAKVVVFVGSLVPVKGVAYLLDAMHYVVALNPEVSLLIAGDGPEEKGLRELAREYRVADNVRWCGRVRHDVVAYYLSAADVFVLPSLSEGLPNVVLEAMAVGSPVVCTDVTGIRDLVRDGANGLLAEPRSSQQLANCILRVLDSVALADGLSRAASETVRGYQWGQVAARVEVEYLQMLETIRARSSAKARRRGIKTT